MEISGTHLAALRVNEPVGTPCVRPGHNPAEQAAEDVQHGRRSRQMSVTVTDQHVAVLRAYLAGDFDKFRQINGNFGEGVDSWEGDGVLLSAAFFEAVDRRFTKSHTLAEVIVFVSSVRARFEETGTNIDPRAAERLILSALGDDDADDLDGQAVVAAQTAMLPGLVAGDNGRPVDVDGLLVEARQLADEWTS